MELIECLKVFLKKNFKKQRQFPALFKLLKKGPYSCLMKLNWSFVSVLAKQRDEYILCETWMLNTVSKYIHKEVSFSFSLIVNMNNAC